MLVRRAREADDAHPSDPWVAPWSEGRGVGSALLLTVQREVARAGFEASTLEVPTANARAASSHRRRGYEVTWQGVKRDGVLAIDLHKTAMRKELARARCR